MPFELLRVFDLKGPDVALVEGLQVACEGCLPGVAMFALVLSVVDPVVEGLVEFA